MARKPITEYVGGRGPRQRIWNAIRLLSRQSDKPFTERQIWCATDGSETDVELSAVRDYRRCLVAAGILDLVSKPKHRYVEATYCLAIDEGIEAPRVRKDGSRVTQGMSQEQMWRTLRVLKGDINARELAAHASTAQIPVAESAAKDYLKHLKHAGYITLTADAKHVGKAAFQARYRLVRNTGPRPLMIQKTTTVYDPNIDEIVWAAPANEETAIYGS